MSEGNLPKCAFCKARETKYKCVICCSPACNICTETVDESYAGYDEELKKVGICRMCKSTKKKVAKESTMKTQASITELFGK